MTNIALTSRADRRGLEESLPSDEDALAMIELPLETIAAAAREVRDRGSPNVLTYSPKVFLPVTRLCRDTCRYCTFATVPSRLQAAYMSLDEVLAVAKAGVRAGCREALFTLGERPEDRWPEARRALDELGFATTLDYVAHLAQRVLEETGLLPHLNPGTMDREEIAKLQPVAASMGLMLETSSTRLCEKDGPHHGCPDKHPARRLATIESAGRLGAPFTTGILVGIGETRRERVESLLAIRDLHRTYGHIQEVIVQNFLPKVGSPMAAHARADVQEHLWTVALARVLFGANVGIQAPPNLAASYWRDLINAGISDWGGISPITADFVNPEAPWPSVAELSKACARQGKTLVPRLTVYPAYVRDAERWLAPTVRPAVLRASDSHALARDGAWASGVSTQAVLPSTSGGPVPRDVASILELIARGEAPSASQIATLFEARGSAFAAVCNAADDLRRKVNGDSVGYVVNRNINYTNICEYKCSFCAFSKGKTHEQLRGKPYRLDPAEFQRRVAEAWDRGATEVCLQGGIHPDYTGHTYLEFVRLAKEAAPGVHVHAFSPLEIWSGARSLGWSLERYLGALKEAGLGSLPGTAAEILDDEIRALLCPDKLNTDQWFEVMAAAHKVGLKSTATIMFGHVEAPIHWARHLLRLREHQRVHNGFTEFVPLPFVANEAPIYLKGRARQGPTLREAILMHAVSRLALHPLFQHVQTSWVKMGPDGAKLALSAGADDIGGTLMNESITRAAGATHGQEFLPARILLFVSALGRTGRQRTTLYGNASEERVAASLSAPPLQEPPTPGRRLLATAHLIHPIQTPFKEVERCNT